VGGLPGGSVPAGKTGDGLPVGIQIVGPRFEEPLILSVMKIVQQMIPIGWPPYARAATVRAAKAASEVGGRPSSQPSTLGLPLRPSRA
jgi:Asp-tRNA(Asn)/Glu-tRNA(Gln) amidotransferase A subunit family amidase